MGVYILNLIKDMNNLVSYLQPGKIFRFLIICDWQLVLPFCGQVKKKLFICGQVNFSFFNYLWLTISATILRPGNFLVFLCGHVNVSFFIYLWLTISATILLNTCLLTASYNLNLLVYSRYIIFQFNFQSCIFTSHNT